LKLALITGNGAVQTEVTHGIFSQLNLSLHCAVLFFAPACRFRELFQPKINSACASGRWGKKAVGLRGGKAQRSAQAASELYP